MALSKILVVDDYEGFRQLICRILEQKTEYQVVQASDGLEAVQKAQALQPDLILLDISLPKLNGLEAGRKIRKVSSNSKILFISQESSADVITTALGLGAVGYIHKALIGSDLLSAIKSVLGGKKFVSSGPEFGDQYAEGLHCHQILFYSDETILLDRLSRCVRAALKT